jgi:CheY-like chemotaxis protein
MSEHTVLYVEDMPVNVLLMQHLFEHLPQADLSVARSGAEAWGLCQLQRPRLLLLDIGLPDCRGDDLLRRLRTVPGLDDVPAVAVTAEDAFDAAARGFDEYWPKPLDLALVRQRLEALLCAETIIR